MEPETADVDAPIDTLAALKELTETTGWKLLCAQADHEYGPRGFGIRMQSAIAQVPVGPDRAYELARVAEEINAIAVAVHTLVKWPAREIQRLSAPKAKGRFDHLRRRSS